MTLTILNADNSLIKIIESLNEKRSKPYELIKDDEIPNAQTLKAIKMSGKGFSKNYKDFQAYMNEVENNA